MVTEAMEILDVQKVTSLNRPQRSTALYLVEADIVEYLRRDVPGIYCRIDELLTIVLDIDERKPVGFALKGFRNFYLKNREKSGSEFVMLAEVLEKYIGILGDKLFDGVRWRAYQDAKQIAAEDEVELRDLPSAA